MRLRQVQAHQEQGHGLRPLRRRGDARVGPPPAHGPHRARGSREPHLVLQVLALQDGPPPRQDDERARARPLLPGLDGHRTRRHRPQGGPDPQRPGVHRRAGEVRRRLQGRDGRRGDSQASQEARPRRSHEGARGADGEHPLQAEPQEDRQAHEGGRGIPRLQLEARVDGAGRPSRHPAGTPSSRPARGRPLRDERP